MKALKYFIQKQNIEKKLVEPNENENETECKKGILRNIQTIKIMVNKYFLK